MKKYNVESRCMVSGEVSKSNPILADGTVMLSEKSQNILYKL
ncbi:hypothetical protein ACDX78_12595 [Virgibacillus oceani]